MKTQTIIENLERWDMIKKMPTRKWRREDENITECSESLVVVYRSYAQYSCALPL